MLFILIDGKWDTHSGKSTLCTPKSHQKSALNAIKNKNTGPRFFHNPKNSAEKNLKMIDCTFPLDGNWSEWSIYSVCSCQAKIDTGTKTKTRLCNNPLRQIGGNFCVPLANNVVDNSTDIQKETQADACPCPLTGK